MVTPGWCRAWTGIDCGTIGLTRGAAIAIAAAVGKLGGYISGGYALGLILLILTGCGRLCYIYRAEFE